MYNLPVCEKCGNRDKSILGSLCAYCRTANPELINCLECGECDEFKPIYDFAPAAIRKPRGKRQCNECLNRWDAAYEAHLKGEISDAEDDLDTDLDAMVRLIKNKRTTAHFQSHIAYLDKNDSVH